MKFDKEPEFHIAIFGFFTSFIWEILQMPFYLLTGLGITVIIEAMATRVPREWDWGWRYSELMPLVPGTNIGLVPTLMWIFIPLITLWFARRQPQP